jgi:hypothetical protein
MSDDGIQRRGDRPRPGEPGYVDMRSTDGKRGYTWPSFTAKNEMSLKHGAMSERRVDPIAEALVTELLERRPDLARYPEALAAWSRAESRCLLLQDWFSTHGLLDGKGKPTADASLLSSSERLAAQLRAELGLSPRAEAQLASEQASAAQSVVNLDELRKRGREALRAGRLQGEAGQLRDGSGGS